MPTVKKSGTHFSNQGHARLAEALRASERPLQDIVDNTTAVIFVKDLQLRYILVNREYELRFRVLRDEIRGKTDFDIHPRDIAETVRANDRYVIETGTSVQFEETLPMPEGERHYVVVKFLLWDRTEKPYAVCGIATDITALKHAEELQQRRARQAALRADIHAAFSSGTELPVVLQRSAEALMRHVDAASAEVWTLDESESLLEFQVGTGLDGSRDAEQARAAIGKSRISQIAQDRRPQLANDILNDVDLRDLDWAKRQNLISFAGHPLIFEERLIGVLAVFARKRLSPDSIEILEVAADVVAQGIERKRAEKQLARLNRTLRTVNECNKALVRATDEYELLRAVCRILVEVGGLRMVWVGYREFDEDRTVRPVAHAGYEAGYLDLIHISWADNEGGRGPMGKAIRTGTTSWTRNFLTDPNMSPWRAEALSRGYISSVSLPLMSAGETFGALALYADEADVFTETTVEQYTDLANNLAYGVVALRTREERERVESEVRQFNASLEKRVHDRTIELVRSNEQLKRAEERLRKHGEQVEVHRDVLLRLAHSDKSDFEKAVRKICSLSATTLDVARASYWSLRENDSTIVCEELYLRDAERVDAQFKGTRLAAADCPAYFAALNSKRPVVADQVLTDPATRGLAESYLRPLSISSMLDAPVWLGGKMVGVLCHEHVGPPRNWSAEEVDFVSALAAMVSLALEESSRAQSEHLLRESEERFSKAFRASPVNITILRLSDRKFIEANDAFIRWFGMSRDGILGHDSEELRIWAHPEDRAKFLADLERDGSVREVECRLRSARGTLHTIVQSADVIEINRQPHMLVIGLDVTQRKRAETELLRTLGREKQLGQLRSNFVSMVSHEFRTPLGIIQSSAEILKDYLDQLAPSEREEHLQSIFKNTRRMAEIMEETLLIGSLDAGRLEFRAEAVDLRKLTQRLVDEVISATDRRCPIELSLANVPTEIQADERLLCHIFSNLLTNAVKYSEAGCAVRFEISSNQAEIVFVIRDQGIGVPELDREWLFNAFHRGHNVADRPGTGLGLVVVKRCLDLQGGTIDFKSVLGQGTSVIVRLPIGGPVSPGVEGGSPEEPEL